MLVGAVWCESRLGAKHSCAQNQGCHETMQCGTSKPGEKHFNFLRHSISNSFLPLYVQKSLALANFFHNAHIHSSIWHCNSQFTKFCSGSSKSEILTTWPWQYYLFSDPTNDGSSLSGNGSRFTYIMAIQHFRRVHRTQCSIQLAYCQWLSLRRANKQNLETRGRNFIPCLLRVSPLHPSAPGIFWSYFNSLFDVSFIMESFREWLYKHVNPFFSHLVLRGIKKGKCTCVFYLLTFFYLTIILEIMTR